jgi:alpha-L-fucosidase
MILIGHFNVRLRKFIIFEEKSMAKTIKFIFPCFLLLLTIPVFSQIKINPDDIQQKMQWFADAKLGIFIHAGIYSVDGVGESWSFHNKRISHADYMKQLDGFSLKKYNPEIWADLIKESGAKYAVITTKHHDGVAMYDTKMNDLSIVKKTPAKQNMIKPFFEELRKRDIKCGAYFSLIDWSYPDYPGFLNDSSRYEIKNDNKRWDKYLKFMHGQIGEILTELNPDLWWFDGDWEHSAEEWDAQKIRSMILSFNPNAIINGRLQGYGDYSTPEQNFPVSRPKFKWWELCMTINDSWGFQHTDSNFKTPYEVITIFADVISNGGNLLLDFGPREDGTIPEESVTVLKELGAWNKKHDEAIFGTVPGMSIGHYYGPSTISKDSTCLYIFLAGNPQNEVIIRGLFNEIESVNVLGSNSPLKWKVVGKISWSSVPGLVYIEAPQKDDFDKYLTVVKIKLKTPLKLYMGEGGLGL